MSGEISSSLGEEAKKYFVPPVPANTTRAEPVGGYSTMGSGKHTERGRDLDLYGTINFRFGQEFSSMKLDLQGFIQRISGNKYPMVIDCNGEILVPSHSGDFNDQFTDNIAKLWAQQNNGIFIPSGFGNPEVTVQFKDMMVALARTRHNYANRDGTYEFDFQRVMHEASMVPNAFNDLVQEARYLDQVRGFNPVSFRERGEVIGLEGIVHKRDGSENDTIFGDTESGFSVNLGLDMRGFGGYHLKVSRRRLSSQVARYECLEKGSDEERAINWLINEAKKNDDRYRIWANFVENEKQYDRVDLIMDSPNLWSADNAKMKKPVMQTQEMLGIFLPVVTSVVKGLARLKKHKADEEIRRRQDLYDVVKGTGTVVVRGFGE